MRFFLLLLLITSVSKAQYSVEGKIVDLENRESLPFVSIAIVGTQKGISTDMEGNFKITYSKKITNLKVSYVGYESVVFKIEGNNNNVKNIVIPLKKTSFQLGEVVIVPGENPAHRIILAASKNREKNNPDNIAHYSCHTYSKVMCDLLVNRGVTDTQNPEYNLSKKLLKLAHNEHFLITESVTERQYKAHGNLKETVLGTKVSGLSDPSFSVLPTTAQPFSFYGDYFKILNKQYFNPLAEGSTQKYFFNIEDTLFNGKDTVFVISFRPSRKRTFLGLKGVLHINTNGFAIQKVTATPCDESSILSIKFEQEYAFVNNLQWFPVSLNYEWHYKNYPSKYAGMKIVGKSIISDINLNVNIPTETFNEQQMVIADDAAQKDDTFWKNHRSDSLTHDEQKTYQAIDSIGKVYHLNEGLKFAQSLITYKYPIGCINLDVNRLLDFNRHEGVRLGLGLHTNGQFLKWATIGGYAAWGTFDNQFKYGGDVSLFPSKQRDMEVNCSYFNDVIEPAKAQYFYPRTSIFQNFAIARMDRVKQYDIKFHSRWFSFLSTDVSIRKSQHEPLYRYDYLSSNLAEFATMPFDVTEFVAKARYAYQERFVQSLGKWISKGTPYPVLHAVYTKGLSILGGHYTYDKISLGIEKTLVNKSLGETKLLLEGGMIVGETPYFTLFNGDGSFNKGQIVYVRNTFQTVGLYEFLSDRYACLFLAHNFRSLLYKSNNEYFKPELTCYLNAGFGSLSNSDRHSQLRFQTMEKGLYELGGIINNILRFNYMDFIYLGVGAGAFCRIGNYTSSVDHTHQNVVYKVAFSLAFQ